MADVKTKPTEISVDDFIGTVESDTRREDAKAVCAMMQRVTGQPPVMWGPSIIGFGAYHYRYDSGHEGEMCRVGFSPRKAQLVFYVGGFAGYEDLLPRLGKHKTSKACLYVNRLKDVDMQVLEEIVRQTWAAMEGDPRCLVC